MFSYLPLFKPVDSLLVLLAQLLVLTLIMLLWESERERFHVIKLNMFVILLLCFFHFVDYCSPFSHFFDAIVSTVLCGTCLCLVII